MGDPFRYMMAKWLYGYGLPLRVLGQIGIGSRSRLLIIGSGIGETAILSSLRWGCRVRGLELHTQLVEQARRRAGEKGLSEKLSFDTLSEASIKGQESHDAALFESVLSFLPNPAETLASSTESLRRGGRIGVLELTWIRPPEPGDVDHIAQVFGGDASLRSKEEWISIFEGLGLAEIGQGTERLGLVRKFWSDFSVSPGSTLSGLAKTLYSVSKSSKSREALRDFKATIKRYREKLAYTYYILERR